MLSVLKLEYRHYIYNILKAKSEIKTTITITNDGEISTKIHAPNGGKVIAVRKNTYPVEEFEKLCKKIELCIKNANTCVTYIDNSIEKLTIFYQYDHIQEVDRGLGSGHTYIGGIIHNFLEKYEFL